VVSEDVSRLPSDTLAYETVEVLVLRNTDFSVLESAQLEALEQWVRLGGQIVVLGGQGAPRTLSSLPESLAPALAARVESIEALPVQALAPDEPMPPGELLVASLTPVADASVLLYSGALDADPLEQGDGRLPLIVERRVGAGAVTVFAADPVAPPLSSWAGMPVVWRDLVAERPSSLWTTPRIGPELQAGTAERLLGLRAPTMNGVFLLIAAYIVLVGPLNYLVLKSRRRLDLAWLTIPCLTAAATAITYGLGGQLHGRTVVLANASVAQVVPEASLARVSTLSAVFAPSDRTYELETDRGLFVGPSGNSSSLRITIDRTGERSEVRFGVSQWSTAMIASEAIVYWPAVVSDASDLSRTNPAGVRLEDTFVVTSGNVRPTGELGVQSRVHVPLGQGPAMGGVYDPYSMMVTHGMPYQRAGGLERTEVVHSLFDSSYMVSQHPYPPPGTRAGPVAQRWKWPLLIGFQDSIAFDIRVRTRTSTTKNETMVVVPLAHP
jgi:hypothetical protein